MNRRHSGTTTVEFAIVGLLLLVIVIGAIELGRVFFVANTLTEATRRGARMAVVCPIGDPRPAQAAVFDRGNGTSRVVGGLTPANVEVSYLDSSSATIGDPAANFALIRYVRVRIVGFSHTLLIPLSVTTFPMSGYSTTLPRESLGIPRAGVVAPC